MGNMKKCRFCQTDIPKSAKVCPNCKRALKGSGCLFGILAVVFLIGIIIVGILVFVGQNDFIQKSVSGVSDDSEYITMDEYNQIETGMSYEEIKEIVGSDGEITSQAESNGIKIVIITWYGNGMAGSNANVTFTNNGKSSQVSV